MPKVYNTVTKKWMFMPDSYVGKYPFQTEEEVAAPTPVAEPAPAPKKKKKSSKVDYKAAATDGDNDGLVQDGTPFERPEGTELSDEEIATRLEEDGN